MPTEKKNKNRVCVYKGCSNYSPKAKYFCCLACSADDYDRVRLIKEKAEIKIQKAMKGWIDNPTKTTKVVIGILRESAKKANSGECA